MRKFDLKLLASLILIIIVGGFINIWLFRNVFWGHINGFLLKIGGMTFFGLCLSLTIFLFRIRFTFQELNYIFFDKMPKEYDATASHEDFFEMERKSKTNWLAVVASMILGLLYGIVFAIFYEEITLIQGVLTMVLYGLAFGLFLIFLIRKDWFSIFYFAKDRRM
ncbi:MAG: hypothetical protein KDC74_07155 [Flavobacteriaceae bacterium]|jgi:hypothetical protein|nr:hypothetical protein [Flavobacteriaceae bacterium]